MQQTSLAQPFLVRLCCSSSVATCQGLQARILARVLPSSVVVLSILSAVFPSACSALLTQAPNEAQIHAAKQTENARFMAYLCARPAAHTGKSRCQGSVLRFAAPIMARCHSSATLTRARWRGKPQKGREGFKRPCPASQGPCLASLPASEQSQGKKTPRPTQCHTTQETMPPQRFARSH